MKNLKTIGLVLVFAAITSLLSSCYYHSGVGYSQPYGYAYRQPYYGGYYRPQVRMNAPNNYYRSGGSGLRGNGHHRGGGGFRR